MELEIVERLCRRFPNHPCMKLGPGDDAAILEIVGSSPQIVVSTDLLTEGVDFLLKRMNPRKIGRKSMCVNLSDLAAMASEPTAAVISVALPKQPEFPDFEENSNGIISCKNQNASSKSVAELMERLCDGFLDAVELPDGVPIAIAGGDTNTWDGPLVISVTVIGRAAGKPLCRRNARIGDGIFVTGALGGSILRHQFTFTPRIREMLALNASFELHAGMDVSDGLTLDLSRLCRSSRCGAELFLEEIPIAQDAELLSRLKPSESEIYDWIPADFASGTPLEHALGDGEDFEILFTAPWEISDALTHNTLGIPVYRIGRILEGDTIYGSRKGETPEILPIRGFQHS